MNPWSATKESPLFLLAGLGLGGYLAVWRNKRALEVITGRRPLQSYLRRLTRRLKLDVSVLQMDERLKVAVSAVLIAAMFAFGAGGNLLVFLLLAAMAVILTWEFS